MRVYHISAVTLKVNEMEKSCKFYSKIPGFKLVYGGTRDDTFATYQIGERNKKTYLNLELAEETPERLVITDFGRIIFHTESVDELYLYMKRDEDISRSVVFESKPADAPWGERFFHIREPSGYQLSFAKPL
jgi:catechol 2,3-dioxygenase-like lactoylglutathione lyase family enzyme